MDQVYKEKALCCGCGACKPACPYGAIEMEPDEEGFLSFLHPIQRKAISQGSKYLDLVSFGITGKFCGPFSGHAVNDPELSFFFIYFTDADGSREQTAAILTVKIDKLSRLRLSCHLFGLKPQAEDPGSDPLLAHYFCTFFKFCHFFLSIL